VTAGRCAASVAAVNLLEVEAHVSQAATSEDLATDLRRAKDGYLEVALRPLAGSAAKHSALLYTTGVEAFHLRLDGQYDVHDFDHEAAGQAEALRTLVGIAAAHLRGDSVPAAEPRLLRRNRACLDIRWSGETYRARA